MIKQKKWESISRLRYKQDEHLVKKWMFECGFLSYAPWKNKEEPRHRMKKKAWRFRVCFTCHKCIRRKKYVPEQIIAKGAYRPFDHCMCADCEEAMRGGRH